MRETIFVVYYKYKDDEEQRIVLFKSEDGAYDYKRYLQREDSDDLMFAIVQEEAIFGNLYDYLN